MLPTVPAITGNVTRMGFALTWHLRPTKFDLVINLMTKKVVGVGIPTALLLQDIKTIRHK